MAASVVMEGHGESRVVWGEGEELDTFMRKVKAYRLQVGDEKKAIGKALLGLGSRIGIMDSLTETDTSTIASLEAALRREFGSSSRSYQTACGARAKLPGETYGMFLAALKSLFVNAFPDTKVDNSVARVLIRTRFLDGINSTVSAQLRLLCPDLDIEDLPARAKQIDEAVTGVGSTPACVIGSVNNGLGQPEPACPAPRNSDEIAQLRAEVSELAHSVRVIQDVVTGACGDGGGQEEGGVARIFPSTGPAGRGRPGSGSAWRRGGASAPGARASLGSERDPAVGRGPLGGQGRSQGPEWGRTDRGMASSGRSRALCWTCGEVGHVQRFCMSAPLARGRGRASPVMCWRCREFGHTQHNCPLSLN